jgi:hypothetical protein
MLPGVRRIVFIFPLLLFRLCRLADEQEVSQRLLVT